MNSFVIAAIVAFLASASASLTPVNANRKYVKPLSQFPGFRTVIRTGQIVGNSLPLGTNVDKLGKPIAAATSAMNCNTYTNTGTNTSICYVPGGYNASAYEISVNPDFTSYITTPNGNVFMIAQFEASTPSTIYVVKIAINPVSGKMFPVWAKPVDFSATELLGLWIPCAGSLSPWNSHLGSEEYDPDAYCIATATSFNGPEATAMSKCMDPSSVAGMMRYFFPHGNFTLEDVKNTSIFNPYMYGRAVEVQIKDNNGGVNVFKHMALGRHSYELFLVMPDNKTVYSTDDGTNTAMWKFVANTAGDLSSGTLYGAKLTQTDANYGGDFSVTWIELGKSSTTEILTTIKSGTTFLDIFEVSAWNSSSVCNSTQATSTPDDCCPAGFRSISKRDNFLGQSCLKLKTGMEKAAAFLESRRYLAYMGGTVELSKFEGLTIDPINKKLYGAMSQIRYGMEDFKSRGSASNTYDRGGPNHVRVPYNGCGCIYAFDLSATWDVTRMYGELCGTPVTVPSRFSSTIGTKIGNKCLDLSEPDNVVYVPGHNMLIIGEDTNENQIDYIYQYDLATKTKTRIFSSNFGAETTSPYWFPNLKYGWSYLTANIQHPYDESDQAMAIAPGASGSGGWIGNWAFKHSDFADGSMLRFLPIPQVRDNATGQYGAASASGYAVMDDNLFTKVQV